MASPFLAEAQSAPAFPARQYMSLQAGRGFAALLVVLHHTGLVVTHDPKLWNRPDIFHWFMGPRLGVAFFFVLSGMVILMAHGKDIGNPSRIGSYVSKRFRRIYPIYWLVLAPVICAQFILASGLSSLQRSPFVMLSSILLVHIRSNETNLLVAWTLFHEVLFYSVFVVLLLNKRLGTILFVVWMAASLVNFRWTTLPENLCSPLHLLFGMGMASAWLLQRKRILHPHAVLAVGSLTFMGSLIYSGWRGETFLPDFLAAGFGTALILPSAAFLESQQRFRVPRWAAFLGEASYSIYLIHLPIIVFFARPGFHADRQLHLPIFCWMLFLFSLGTGAGCLLHIFIERPLLQWLGRTHLRSMPNQRGSPAA